MTPENRQQLTALLQNIEKEEGLDLLATTLSECLCTIAARRSDDKLQIITVNTGFFDADVHVVLRPCNSFLDNH